MDNMVQLSQEQYDNIVQLMQQSIETQQNIVAYLYFAILCLVSFVVLSIIYKTIRSFIY